MPDNGGGRRSYTYNPDDLGCDPDDDGDDDYTITNGHADDWVAVAGFGRLSYQELEKMVDNGTVKEVVDKENKTISYRKA